MRRKSDEPFVREIVLLRDRVRDWARYPFTIPAVNRLDTLALHPKVTFLVGENGSGKSTLIEAIAIAAGFDAEGGSQNFRFSTKVSESPLHEVLRRDRSQLIVATHSPILLAYPEARIYALTSDGLADVRYEDTEHYALTRDFLLNRERYLRRLFGDSEPE
jgi:predicted ATPase